MACMPTDLELIAYVILKTESPKLSIPMWMVHELDFWNHKPQKLAETYEVAGDRNWYFVSSTTPTRSGEEDVAWKRSGDEKRIYAEEKMVGCKSEFEFLDENNQEWQMCVYSTPDVINFKLNWTLGKIYKCIEDKDENEDEMPDAITPDQGLERFMPTDSDTVAYLKLQMVSRNLSIPMWPVHEVDFWNHRPQQLAETYKAASDGSWYFVYSKPSVPTIFVDWKVLDIPTTEQQIEKEGNLVALKYKFELVDQNNQEWQMCQYYLNVFEEEKTNWTLGKIYKARRFPRRFMPTDLDTIAYLKLKMDSPNLSLPMWVVHKLDFWNHKPRQLAETYEAASDGNWYFVFSPAPTKRKVLGWKHLDVPITKERIYKDEFVVGAKSEFESVDENNQEWRMCFYSTPDFKNMKWSKWTLGKIYKRTEDEDADEECDAVTPDQGFKRWNPSRFMPTDLDAIAYLKLKAESPKLSIPMWVVHELDFWKYDPHGVGEMYEAAGDGNWYFLFSTTPPRREVEAWKALDVPMTEKYIYKDKLVVGYKFEFESLDEEWRMCFYRIPDLINMKLNDWTLGKMYKHIKNDEMPLTN